MGDKAKKLWYAVAMALGLGIGGFGVLSPAQAAWADCPNARVCLWADASYTGGRVEATVGWIKTLPGDCWILTASYNNWASSVRDRTGYVSSAKTVFFDLDGVSESLFASGAGGLNGSGIFSDPGLATGAPVSGANNKVSAICIL